jgi:xanthine dehydrogenase accessory factor
VKPASPGDLLEEAAHLRRDGQPFVLATVVRSLKPASARPGDRALLHADGSSVGWVGGGCVHTSIEREAMAALADGAPRLVRLSPEPTGGHREDDEGIVSYPMTCHSGGTLEIYLEPVLPPPELVVLGSSPVAEALIALGEPLGFRVRSDLSELGSTRDAWVVAAGMSSGDDHPLVRAALERGVAYVAMVASRRRTDALRDELRANGVTEDAIGRLKAPAGLDIGAATGPEIALSILAEIVQLRRARARAVHPSASAPASLTADVQLTAIDPLCGMEVSIATARWTAERDGQTIYFCSPACRNAYAARLTE